MKPILEEGGRTFWLQVLDRVSDFVAPFDGAPYPCLLWDTRGGQPDQELKQLSASLIASNCRYAVCGGRDCERWHDAVDEAFLAQNLPEPEAEARFVLTTWHTNESFDDVGFFFVMNTNFDHHEFKQFLIVQLGSDWETQQALVEAVKEHATTSDDEDEQEEDWSGDAA